ncbi:MAG: zinc ribbon domain-containing protein [Anaerolineae bacterium]
MRCPNCGTVCSSEDNFCRKCGASLISRNLPAVPQAGYPVPWEQVKRGLVRGAAALAVGTALELARRGIQRHLTPGALADRVEGWLRRRRTKEAEARRVPVRVVREEPALPPAEEYGITWMRAIFVHRTWRR